MDYDALTLFVTLARTLHFGRTSRACHISPSALSRAIQRLEETVGWPLVERDPRSVKLTPEGVLFQTHATDVLERWHTLQRRLERKAAVLSGTISIFASVTACQTFLPRWLAAFRAAHPDVHISLETGYAADALALVGRGAVDVAVAALPERVPASLLTRRLLRTPLVLVAPASDCEASRLVARRPVPWGEVPMVLPATGLARASAEKWFRRRRVEPRIYGELPGNEAILSLVALGCGVGIVPELVMQQSPLRAEVQPLPADGTLGEFHIGVTSARRKLKSPLVRAFWDSLGDAR